MKPLNSKRLGVIGGMGPDASADFIKNIIRHTKTNGKDQEHIRIIADINTDTPDRTQAILSGNYRPVIDALSESVRFLEAAGVSEIAVPCNTAAFFIPYLQPQTNVNFINIVKETAKEILMRAKGRQVTAGIIATEGTLKSQIYHKVLAESGITPHSPDAEMQSKISDVIYKQVKSTGKGSIDDFNEIVNGFSKQNCDYIILGCTEFSYFTNNHKDKVPGNCIDSMAVLERVSIERAGFQYKE